MMGPELNVAVLPAGRWGTAFAKAIASDNNFDVKLYLREPDDAERFNLTHRNPRYFSDTILPDNITASASLEELVTNAEILVLAIPSHALRSFYRQIKPFDTGQDIVCLTKGLEVDTNLMMSEVLEQENPGIISRFSVVSGPNFAAEIVKGLPACSVVAAKELGYARAIQETLTSENLRLYAQDDLIGVQLGGAFKNVIAIAAGASDGLEMGENARAGLITRGCEEIKRLGMVLGGNERTFGGLSGQGDLWLTATSPQSRNHQFGFELVRGRAVAELLDSGTVYEGYFTAKAMIELAREKGVSVPIAEVVYEVLYQNLSIPDAINRLRSRDLTTENGY